MGKLIAACADFRVNACSSHFQPALPTFFKPTGDYTINKLLLALMLSVTSTSAMAEWRWAVEDAVIGITAYVDLTSINKTGDMAKMSSLVDFRAVQGKTGYKFLSQKEQDEYDCKEQKSRMLSFSRHSKNMAGGEVVFSDNTPSRWAPVTAGSAGEILWALACGKQSLPTFK